MKSRISNIIDEFLNLEEVKRIHELENYIDNNPKINEVFFKIKETQKKMVNAKEFNQTNLYIIYSKEYEALKAELLDLPFVDEYLELLDIVNNMLMNLSNEIEYKLNVKLNEKEKSN